MAVGWIRGIAKFSVFRKSKRIHSIVSALRALFSVLKTEHGKLNTLPSVTHNMTASDFAAELGGGSNLVPLFGSKGSVGSFDNSD